MPTWKPLDRAGPRRGAFWDAAARVIAWTGQVAGDPLPGGLIQGNGQYRVVTGVEPTIAIEGDVPAGHTGTDRAELEVEFEILADDPCTQGHVGAAP